ncbi:hypothetical protein Aca07nite_19840 [Actinoplanes capillaceus]|uniref:Uncharacterized protein n=1 Tax=Actinoplanes campanulatus TaxID=113559 RepID=A0ABQ3WDN3_9ACTN|nr:hypothetical protein [Actinoplanes capillaceus]GID44709.1 hypothetical protein Aca07nite_19840 [Actinoplanes capillaceus]
MPETRVPEQVRNLMLADERSERRTAAIAEDAGRARTAAAVRDQRSIGVTRSRIDVDEF